MFGKHQKAKTPPPPTGSAADPGALISEGREVRALLAKGSTKSAVELAKQIHKRCGTPASEALVVEAYGARIRSLLEHSLTAEAKALLELVRERYSSAKQSLADIAIVVASSEGSLDDLVRPLNDPALPKERRAAIESAIKRQLTDLSALAHCTVLPPDHPLRVSAAALGEALASVTSGPVGDGALLLPQVSHRGPWALGNSWCAPLPTSTCERTRPATGAFRESTPTRFPPGLFRRCGPCSRRDAYESSGRFGFACCPGGRRRQLCDVRSHRSMPPSPQKHRARSFRQFSPQFPPAAPPVRSLLSGYDNISRSAP